VVVNIEAPRPSRKDGTRTAGLPGKVISFILCPLTPPIPLGRDGARSGQSTCTMPGSGPAPPSVGTACLPVGRGPAGTGFTFCFIEGKILFVLLGGLDRAGREEVPWSL
jgi:hypothetical protein